MQSVTGGSAKELLPLGDKTVIEQVLVQALKNCEHAIVVWDNAKGQLPDGVAWVPQVPQRGLAPAIASGVSTEETNLIFLPDAVFFPFDPSSKLSAMGEGDIALALTQVSDDEVSKFGICEVDENGWVTKMLEKPSPDATKSRWAICGTYRMSGQAAELLVNMVAQCPLDGPETDLSPFFKLAMDRGLRIAGCFLDNSVKRFDCGDPAGYRAAVEAYAS